MVMVPPCATVSSFTFTGVIDAETINGAPPWGSITVESFFSHEENTRMNRNRRSERRRSVADRDGMNVGRYAGKSCLKDYSPCKFDNAENKTVTISLSAAFRAIALTQYRNLCLNNQCGVIENGRKLKDMTKIASASQPIAILPGPSGVSSGTGGW